MVPGTDNPRACTSRAGEVVAGEVLIGVAGGDGPAEAVAAIARDEIDAHAASRGLRIHAETSMANSAVPVAFGTAPPPHPPAMPELSATPLTIMR